MTTRERYDTVVVYWTLGRGTDPQVIGFVFGLLVALFVRWRWRSSAGILLWLLAFGVTTAGDVHEVVTAPKWLAGLVRVSPFVVFSILPFAVGGLPTSRGGDRRSESSLTSALPMLVGITTLVYLVMAFAGVDTTGGKSLGPRLLLPLLPLLAVSSMIVLASYLRSTLLTDRLVGGVGVALVAAAVTIHLAGTIPAYRGRNADDASAIRAAAAANERIVVADDVFTAQLLLPLYDRKIVLLADTIEGGRQLGAMLAAHRVGALLVSRNVEPAVGLRPLTPVSTGTHGRMVLQAWRP